jgi:hypothetical protein
MKNVTPQRSRSVRGEEGVASPTDDESELERVEEREEVEEEAGVRTL